VTALLWLRRDLRLHDNPALCAAAGSREPVVPVFCFDDRLLTGRHASGPRTQFLLECLAEVDRLLRERGSGLVIRRGPPERELPALADQLGAGELHFASDAGPYARHRDARVIAALERAGVQTDAHPGCFVLDELDSITTSENQPYSVFTPFHRAWLRQPRRGVLPAPSQLPALSGIDRGELPSLDELGLHEIVPEPVQGGEGAARERVEQFLHDAVEDYDETRNALGGDGASRLSSYLHFGCISPREIEQRLPDTEGGRAFARQLCWRDFYAHVLRQSPDNAHREYQSRYRGAIRWRRATKEFEAWCAGQTGFPLVDAGMRQLRHEGWMHNRARLTVGSFLTKDLGIDWRWGERWFMRWLIDGDEANNNGNWQWIASVGVDPQPAFRSIYNPARQQQRFDPEGTYVRRYVPELAEVPDRYLAEPWTMPVEVQLEIGCEIGRDYPRPIVDHAAARREALDRYASVSA
jgi:deoxyribodipyrimidine photo-lyase